jgi:RNA polymerase sigma-70 factor, ECF subfamily
MAPNDGAEAGDTVADRDLVVAAQRGDADAYVELMRTRADHLFAIAQRILRDVDRAEDAVQDALVEAWRDLRDLRDPERFDAWLRRLVVNTSIAQAARERRRTANLRVLSGEETGGADDLADVARRDLLDRGFRRLPPQQRAILVLHHFLGYAPSEIAETLNIPPGTARSRLHNAHRAMRAALDADTRAEAVGGGLA